MKVAIFIGDMRNSITGTSCVVVAYIFFIMFVIICFDNMCNSIWVAVETSFTVEFGTFVSITALFVDSSKAS